MGERTAARRWMSAIAYVQSSHISRLKCQCVLTPPPRPPTTREVKERWDFISARAIHQKKVAGLFVNVCVWGGRDGCGRCWLSRPFHQTTGSVLSTPNVPQIRENMQMKTLIKRRIHPSLTGRPSGFVTR